MREMRRVHEIPVKRKQVWGEGGGGGGVEGEKESRGIEGEVLEDSIWWVWVGWLGFWILVLFGWIFCVVLDFFWFN